MYSVLMRWAAELSTGNQGYATTRRTDISRERRSFAVMVPTLAVIPGCPALAVVIEEELIRVRTSGHRVDFTLAFGAHPAFDEIRREYVAAKQILMVLF